MPVLSAILWVNVLAVFFGVLSVPDGKLRTVVETGETHHTLVLDPDGLFVHDPDRLNGTVSLAQAAANALASHRKV
jgi:hypothetical protein